MILKTSEFKYAQARKRILDAILAGDPAADAVLPSEQTLRKQLGIGRNTLRTALQELEEEGIIIKQHGRQSRINPDALKKKKSPIRRIAWVDTTPIGQTNPIYFDIFRSFSDAAVIRNVKIDYISLTLEAMAESFFPRQHEYDGLILGEFILQSQRYLDRINHKNCVCVDCAYPGIPHCVKTDCYLGGQLAARTLLESGHQRPVYLGYAKSVVPYPPFHERFHGFSDFFAEAGHPLTPDRVFEIITPDDENNFPGFLRRRLRILEKTDCVFASCDRQAADIIHALRDLGFDVPEQISVIGFDGLTLSRFLSPSLTTIRQPVEEIGHKTLEIVLNPAESKSYPEIIQIPPTLQPGDSLRNRNKKDKQL